MTVVSYGRRRHGYVEMRCNSPAAASRLSPCHMTPMAWTKRTLFEWQPARGPIFEVSRVSRSVAPEELLDLLDQAVPSVVVGFLFQTLDVLLQLGVPLDRRVDRRQELS